VRNTGLESQQDQPDTYQDKNDVKFARFSSNGKAFVVHVVGTD
jgi:hypothetical protein